MKIKYISTLLFITSLFSFANAQNPWSLQACVERAIDANLQVQNSKVALQSAEVDILQAKHSRYPNLSFSTNVGWNFGRTVDPTQNMFTTETFFSNGASLNSNVILFNGNKINNTIKLTQANLFATAKDLEQTKRDISLQVSNIYINILFAKENLANAERQRLQTQDQLNMLIKHIEVGNRPDNDRLELEAQLAMNDQSVIENQNILSIQLLSMKKMLRLNSNENFDIVVPDNVYVSTDPDLITFDELFLKAQENQASLAAAEWRIKSASINEKVANAESIPSLVAGGNVRTNYSNKGYNITGYNQQIVEQEIYFNNQEATIGIPQNIPIIEQTPYFDQINNNISYGIGLSLNVPLYSNYNIKATKQKARLNVERAVIGYDQALESLKTTVAQAYADAKAAKMRFEATEKTKNAQALVYNNALKRFELGSTGVFELSRLKSIYETADTNHLIAKFDYIFKSRILDYYLGNPIRLD